MVINGWQGNSVSVVLKQSHAFLNASWQKCLTSQNQIMQEMVSYKSKNLYCFQCKGWGKNGDSWPLVQVFLNLVFCFNLNFNKLSLQ